MFSFDLWPRNRVSLVAFAGLYIVVAGFLVYHIALVLGVDQHRISAPIVMLASALFLVATALYRHIFLMRKFNQVPHISSALERGTGYIWIDAHGNILLVSDGAYSLLPGNSLVGQNISSFWTNPKDIEGIHAKLNKLLDFRVNTPIDSLKGSESLIYRVNQEQSSAMELELSWASHTDVMIALVRMRPASTNTVAALPQDHQAIKQLLMEGSLSARVVIDGNGLVVDINKAMEDLFGYSSAELLGKPMAEFIIPEHLRKAHFHGLNRYLQTGEEKIVGQRVEVNGQHKSGEEIPVELAVSAINLTGDVYFGAEMRDLREEYSNKEKMRYAQTSAEFANMAKSRFLATMSHEIRTPLNALLGIVNLVRADLDDPHQVSLLTTAENSGMRLMSLLKNVLDYSKIEAGEMSIEQTTFSPIAIAKDLVALYKPTAQAQGIKLSVRENESSEYFTVGDDHKVTQIISNLLSNAIKFTETGEVEVTVEKSFMDASPVHDTDNAPEAETFEKRPSYKISVRDTGIGMTLAQTEEVFTAFVQVDDTDTRKYLGTGLGLSISQHLAHLMGGDIGLTSKKDVGSCFTLELPLELVAAQVKEPIVQRHIGPINTTKRILLVEDSAPNQLVVKAALERRGYTVEVVDSGLAACELITKERPLQDQFGLVLMDVQMPGMDGLEATRWIRRQKFQQPIIALTAKAYQEDERACLEAGMDDFLTKPIDYDLLSSRIAMWLGRDEPGATFMGTRTQEIRELMGETAFGEALAVFAIEVEAKLADIHDGLNVGDFAKVERACHTLSGVFSGYGFDELHHICTAIQESCVAHISPVEKTVERLDELAQELLVNVRAYSVNASA